MCSLEESALWEASDCGIFFFFFGPGCFCSKGVLQMPGCPGGIGGVEGRCKGKAKGQGQRENSV